LRGPVELSVVAEVILLSVKIGPEDLNKQTAGKEMLERINIISKWIKHNNASETACLASQKESSNNKQREDDEQISWLKIAQRFSVTPYGGIFQL
jgi:hypothetical protein